MSLFFRIIEMERSGGGKDYVISLSPELEPFVAGPMICIELDPLVSPEILKALWGLTKLWGESYGTFKRIHEILVLTYENSIQYKDRIFFPTREIEVLIQKYPCFDRLLHLVGHLGAARAHLAR